LPICEISTDDNNDMEIDGLQICVLTDEEKCRSRFITHCGPDNTFVGGGVYLSDPSSPKKNNSNNYNLTSEEMRVKSLKQKFWWGNKTGGSKWGPVPKPEMVSLNFKQLHFGKLEETIWVNNDAGSFDSANFESTLFVNDLDHPASVLRQQVTLCLLAIMDQGIYTYVNQMQFSIIDNKEEEDVAEGRIVQTNTLASRALQELKQIRKYLITKLKEHGGPVPPLLQDFSVDPAVTQPATENQTPYAQIAYRLTYLTNLYHAYNLYITRYELYFVLQCYDQMNKNSHRGLPITTKVVHDVRRWLGKHYLTYTDSRACGFTEYFMRTFGHGLREVPRSLFQALHEVYPRRVYCRESGIHGYGLFSQGRFRCGQILCEYNGEVYNHNRLEYLERRRSENEANYMFRSHPMLSLDAISIGNMARLANHSCEPNARPIIVKSGDLWRSIDKYKDLPETYINRADDPYKVVRETNVINRILLVAIRDIKKDDEITFDYSFDMDDSRELKCYCGTESCIGRYG